MRNEKARQEALEELRKQVRETPAPGLTGMDFVRLKGKVRTAHTAARLAAIDIYPEDSTAAAYERGRRDALAQVMTMLDEATNA